MYVDKIPDWADEIAIDPDGHVWAYEGGAYFLGDKWIPVDDFDGLRYECIAKIDDIGTLIASISNTNLHKGDPMALYLELLTS